jgi:hypothetical protein
MKRGEVLALASLLAQDEGTEARPGRTLHGRFSRGCADPLDPLLEVVTPVFRQGGDTDHALQA